MTIEDQDAVIGRLLGERRELVARQHALFVTASKTGELLRRVGAALESLGSVPRSRHPIDFRADGVTVGIPGMSSTIVRGKFPVVEEIQRLLAELQAVENNLAAIENQVKSLGT